ncbi:hypothetical protein EOM09_05640, partial [bacterium]|nr:hypothetical protein [bacterium]
MERGKKTSFILRQFKKKSKRFVKKDFFTEFFYLNKSRRAIEFLENSDGKFIMEHFLKEFLPNDFRDFISLKILNDAEEEIKTWYFDEENLCLVLNVNWGFKKQEISIDLDIENFMVSVIDEEENILRSIDYTLFNDYLISFLTIQTRI